MQTIKGKIVFDEPPESFDCGLLSVMLHDAINDAEDILRAIGKMTAIVAQNPNKLAFELTTKIPLDLYSTYGIFAHLSLHPGNSPNQIQHGDYVGMQSYNVNSASEIEIKLIQVGL